MPELNLKAIRKDFQRVNEFLRKEEYETARVLLELIIIDFQRVSECLKNWARLKEEKVRLGQRGQEGCK